MIHALKTGDWLRRDRLRAYPLIIVAITVVSVCYVLVVNSGVLPNGSPFGSDFVSFWVAAREALAGRPEVPYLADRFAVAQDALFGDGNFYAFFYPPHYLAYMLPFGALPFYAALAIWTGLSLFAALIAIMAITGRRVETVLLTLAFPATYLTFAHGQNAFLAAALFAGALTLLPARPVMAGVLFGLLTFKPQLGLLIPLALLAGGHWRAIMAAGATSLLVAGLSLVLFGAGTWELFLRQSSLATETLRDGIVGWNKMISPYAMLRLTGAGHLPAMTIQAAVSLGVAADVMRVWRRNSAVSREIRSALLLTGALLATPFGLSYDLFLLAPAIAFAAMDGMRQNFSPWTKTVLAAVYLSPFALMGLTAINVAVTPLILVGFFLHLCALAPAQDDASPKAAP